MYTHACTLFKSCSSFLHLVQSCTPTLAPCSSPLQSSHSSPGIQFQASQSSHVHPRLHLVQVHLSTVTQVQAFKPVTQVQSFKSRPVSPVQSSPVQSLKPVIQLQSRTSTLAPLLTHIYPLLLTFLHASHTLLLLHVASHSPVLTHTSIRTPHPPSCAHPHTHTHIHTHTHTHRHTHTYTHTNLHHSAGRSALPFLHTRHAPHIQSPTPITTPPTHLHPHMHAPYTHLLTHNP